MNPHSFPNPGGKQRVKTDSEPLGTVQPGLTIPPVFVQPAAFGAPIYYQGQRPACSAHAGAWYAAFKLGLTGKVTPNFTWVDIKQNGSDKNPSDGATMADIFASIIGKGVDDFEPLENDVTLTDAQYASALRVTQDMKSAAALKKVTGTPYYIENPTFGELKTALYAQKAIILLVQIGAEWWTDAKGNNSWSPLDVLPIRPPQEIVGEHFIVLHGNTEQWGYFANSWSKDWGMGGHGYFGEDYMPFVKEAGWLA